MAAIFFIFLGIQAYAQETKPVSGTVIHASDNTPIPGAIVFVKGTSNGTVTDFDGRYAIKVSPNQTLVFSYVGFSTQEILVGNDVQINVGLQEDAQALDEVVVVGYGSQRKSDLTGSVAVVDADEAKKLITHDVAKMLQGQAPGVTVQSYGEPGGFVNIKIRGITSFSNNNPLFVIDGVLVDSPYDFATGDIESIQVLKDASAAAIYGHRGGDQQNLGSLTWNLWLDRPWNCGTIPSQPRSVEMPSTPTSCSMKMGCLGWVLVRFGTV